MKERVTAARAGDENVDSPIAVEIAEDRIARVGTAARPKPAVASVKVPSRLLRYTVRGPLSDEKEVQIAIVIEVDEKRFARALDVGNSSLRRHVGERPVAVVAEQVAASFAADCEQIQPAIVVVVREGRVRCALRK